MDKFLSEVAGLFAHRDDLPKMCFVFPNRRSSLFFQRYLGLAADKPVFSPTLLTIGDLFESLSGYRRLDKIELLDILYKVYQQVAASNGVEPDSFDRFIFWGDIILADFDDIDKYLVDAGKLLTNIKDLKDLSVSYEFLSQSQKEAIAQFCNNFAPEHISSDPDDKKKMFSQTWDMLLPLYEGFKQALESKGAAYEGMIYRKVAQQLNLSSLKEKYTEMVFVGLNALNECEKKLLDELQKEGFADFYWDFFGPMVTDPDNKAGDFVRENVARYKSANKLEECAKVCPQEFEVISVPSAVGQAKMCSSILSSLKASGGLEGYLNTAVILPDESLLFPMINSLPDEVSEVNVTMGYPLSASNVSDFFSIVERLQTGAREKQGQICFYHKEVLELIDHPFFCSSAGEDICRKVRRDIISQNRVFVPQSWLREQGQSKLFDAAFRYVEKTSQFFDYQTALIYQVQERQNDVEVEFLYHYQKAVLRLGSLGLDWDSMEKKSYFSLLNQYVSLISIPYRGEPLSGLQIMGPLETRALDFENVIMLSVGEGIFPKKNVSASLIPYNLRRGFGLPTYEFQDSIWAYYFYRSIFRAKKIFLLYDSRTEGLQSGEESRYIKQLQYHYNLNLKRKVASYSLASNDVKNVVARVDKTQEVMDELAACFSVDENDKARKSLSASALNTYINCPFKFYYEYVKGIREEDEVTEDVDAGLFGSIYHKVMQKIYEARLKKTLTKAEILSVMSDSKYIDTLIVDAFRQECKISEIEGRNLILKSLISRYVKQTLQIDADQAPITVLGVETFKQMKYCPITLGREIKLIGYIDRIDRDAAGQLRVVDYKTGKVDNKAKVDDVDAIFDASKKDRPYIALQLYIYSLLMSQGSDGDSGDYAQCIYSLREIFKGLPAMMKIDPDNLEIFRGKMEDLIDNIFNPSQPFIACGDEEGVCKYCDIKKLCGR